MSDAGQDEGRGWQRLDQWLWCARFLKHRTDCARLVAGGRLRINRQPTDKPHARLRVGDLVTLAWRQEVRVIVVVAMADRRGPPAEARGLYREIVEDGSRAGGCGAAHSAPYPASVEPASRSA